MRSFRPTIRLRLTVLYGSLFLAAGIVLLVVNYTLVRQSLPATAEAHREPFVEEISFIVEERQRVEGFAMFPPPVLEARSHSVPEVFAAFESDLQAKTLDQLMTQSVVALGLTGAVAIMLGWLVAGRALQPVHQITETAKSASQSNLKTRVDLDGPSDELKELADTFDQMLARLEAVFESRRRFAAQASHELRTPISVMLAEADVALAAEDRTDRERSLAESIRTQAARSEALIDSLLTLSRSESTLYETEPVDLAELAGDVVGELASMAGEHGVEVDLNLADGWVLGDRVLLERMVTNLVTNAFVHNEPDASGRRWMLLNVETHCRETVLTVVNSGPRLGPDEVERFFEPFQRRDGHKGHHRRGVGLGLAIVRSVVLTHGGTVAIQPRNGGGLEVVVRLPASR